MYIKILFRISILQMYIHILFSIKTNQFSIRLYMLNTFLLEKTIYLTTPLPQKKKKIKNIYIKKNNDFLLIITLSIKM